MFGPGLLLQSVAVSSASTLTGKGNSVMLMWGRDDEEANNGATGCGEFSRHAPVRRKALARARNELVRMIRFSFLHRDGCQNCESFRSHTRRCGRATVGQGTCRDGAWSAQRHWCRVAATIELLAVSVLRPQNFGSRAARISRVTFGGVRASHSFEGRLTDS